MNREYKRACEKCPDYKMCIQCIDKIPDSMINTLKELSIYNDGDFEEDITIIPDKFINLETLYVNKYLNFSKNLGIISIPNTFINLRRLDVSNNKCLTELPDTLVNLEFLHCRNTPLFELSKTYEKLKNLDCSETRIIELPDTYKNLIV